jgi:hypothetical protein
VLFSADYVEFLAWREARAFKVEPIYLELELQSKLLRLASAKSVDYSAHVNALLKKTMENIELFN